MLTTLGRFGQVSILKKTAELKIGSDKQNMLLIPCFYQHFIMLIKPDFPDSNLEEHV
jgi:hypothetical protein